MSDELTKDEEIISKATAGPWHDGWTNEAGAGVTGPSAAGCLCPIDNAQFKNLPIVIRPNAIRQGTRPETWYGEVLGRTYKKEDAAFIARARTRYPALVQEVRELRGLMKLGLALVVENIRDEEWQQRREEFLGSCETFVAPHEEGA